MSQFYFLKIFTFLDHAFPAKFIGYAFPATFLDCAFAAKPNLPALTRWQPRPHCSLLLATLVNVSNCVLYKRLVSYHTAFSLRAVV